MRDLLRRVMSLLADLFDKRATRNHFLVDVVSLEHSFFLRSKSIDAVTSYNVAVTMLTITENTSMRTALKSS